jgi:hypothetical protein
VTGHPKLECIHKRRRDLGKRRSRSYWKDWLATDHKRIRGRDNLLSLGWQDSGGCARSGLRNLGIGLEIG